MHPLNRTTGIGLTDLLLYGGGERRRPTGLPRILLGGDLTKQNTHKYISAHAPAILQVHNVSDS
jgi:hypothetical protein